MCDKITLDFLFHTVYDSSHMSERAFATMPPGFYFPPSPDSVPCKLNVGSKGCSDARKARDFSPLPGDIVDKHPQSDSSLIEIYCKGCPVAAQATIAAWTGLTRSKAAA